MILKVSCYVDDVVSVNLSLVWKDMQFISIPIARGSMQFLISTFLSSEVEKILNSPHFEVDEHNFATNFK